MSDSGRKSQNLNQPSPKIRLASASSPPAAADIERMFKSTGESPGTEFEWVWTEESLSRTYRLVGKGPIIKERDAWEEVDDDPQWTLLEDRSQGNLVLWEYKTRDVQMVMEIVRMINTQALKAGSKSAPAPAGDEYSPIGWGTQVFDDSITEPVRVEADPSQASGFQQIAAVLQSLASSGSTGKLEVWKKEALGQIFLEAGAPVHAHVSGATGDRAARELISWLLANVSFTAGERAETRSVTRQLASLIREGSVLLDQKRFLAKANLTFESYLVRRKKNIRPTELKSMLSELQMEMYKRLDRKCTLADMVRDLHLEIWEWSPALFHLMNQGLVGIIPPGPERATALTFLHDTKLDIDELVNFMVSQQTGIYSYRAFLLFLLREYHWFQLYDTPLSLIVFEVKSRAEGAHARTTRVSPQTANLLARKIEIVKRPLDVFAHFESFDYALLLPHTDLKQAAFLAGTVVQALTKAPRTPDQEGSKLNLFCGVASLPHNGSNLERLMAAARAAKEQAKEQGQSIFVAQGDQSESYASQRAASAGQSSPPQKPSDALEPLQVGDLLIRAGQVSPEQIAQAQELMAKMLLALPLDRILAMEGLVKEHTVETAVEIHSLVKNRRLAVDDAVKALKLVGNHGLDLDSALKRVGTARVLVETSALGELLKDADLVKKKQLQTGLRRSAVTGLPLGCVLINMGVLSKSLLNAALSAEKLIGKGLLNRKSAIEALKTTRARSSSLQLALHAHKFDVSASEWKLGPGELLALGGAISETELLAAREAELVDGRDLEKVLIDGGYVDENCLSTVKQLLNKIDDGSLSKDQATQILKSLKFSRTSANMPGQSHLPAVADQPQETPREVDRIELLKSAGFVTDQQIRQVASTVSEKISLLRTLFDRGLIDQPALDLSSRAKRRIEAGEVDVEQAIAVLKYCREHSLGFDEGLDLLGSSSTSLFD